MMRPVVQALAWIAGVTILAGLALHRASGDEVRVARYTGYVMPWLLLGVGPGAVWAWLVRARALAGVLAASAALIALAHAWPDRSAPAAAASGPALSVMSFNTWSRNRDAPGIARVVLETGPDLLLLQEIPPDVFRRVLPLLRELYGGGAVHAAYEPEIQQAVVSRYPLGPSIAMRDKGQAQEVTLHLPAGAIKVLNVHPLRAGGWRSRHDQLAALLEEDVLPERMPVILGGDLNAPEHSQVYRLVAARLGNAHREAGSGLGFTYPAAGLRVLGVPAFPVVRIDHVFFSRHFTALRAGTLPDSGGSDHRPVVAVLGTAAGSPPAATAASGGPR